MAAADRPAEEHAVMLEALIFDVDGTLADTEEVHRVAFNRAFAEAGLPWQWDVALYGRLLQVTGGKERIRHYIDAYTDGTGAAPDPRFIAALHERKTALYAELVSGGAVPLRPGVAALLGEARAAGVRLAIATTTSLPNVEALLQAALGAQGSALFEVIAAGDSVPRKKPAPDIYLSALAQLGLGPGACLAVEDSRNGLRSALAAGLATLIVRSTYTRDEDFAGAARVLDGFEDLREAGSGPALLAPLQALHAGNGARAP